MFNLNYITMKKNTLLIGVLTLLGASSAFAQDLVISTMKDNAENIELVQDAKFDPGYGNVGNTSNETIICLGEVDFGTDGNTYQATGVEFAQGWGGYDILRYVVLHAGNTFEESVPFTEMEVIRTFGYHCFETFAWNMKDEEGFTRPTGKQKVWLTFREGNGNLRSVIFYQDKIAEEGMQPWINELPGYEEKATTIYGNEFQIAVDVDPENPDDPFKDCKYDEEHRCWGGIRNGFIVKSSEPIDFGEGDYQQLVAFIGHDGERYREYMEFYIDEVKPENMIAKTWSGINLEKWNDFTPVATKLKEVKGSHYLFVKWSDATNLEKIELVKENLWFENPDCGIIYEDVQPSEDAVLFTTKGEGTTGGDWSQGDMEWEILVTLNTNVAGEGSNIGYTKNGIVVAYYDIDFKDGEYKRAIINHSCDKTYIGTIEEANFSLYIDLDDIDWSVITTPEEVKNALIGREPITVVRAQGTGGWGTKLSTAAPLKQVEGVHTIYVVYNLPDGAGANIYGLYLDPNDGSGTGIKPSAAIEGMEIYSINGEIVVNTKESANVAIYTISGVQVANRTLPAGTTTISNLPVGLYILKATNKEGAVTTSKLMIK